MGTKIGALCCMCLLLILMGCSTASINATNYANSEKSEKKEIKYIAIGEYIGKPIYWEVYDYNTAGGYVSAWYLATPNGPIIVGSNVIIEPITNNQTKEAIFAKYNIQRG